MTTHHRRHGGKVDVCIDCHKKINKHQKFRRSGSKIIAEIFGGVEDVK